MRMFRLMLLVNVQWTSACAAGAVRGGLGCAQTRAMAAALDGLKRVFHAAGRARSRQLRGLGLDIINSTPVLQAAA